MLSGEVDHRDSLLTAGRAGGERHDVHLRVPGGVPEAGARALSGSRTAGGKVLAVLGAFTRERPALTLSEIARAVDVPLSTAHRLVAELCSWGALERGDDGRYRIGLRIWELGALAPRGLGLREAALPFMEDLYEVTHENVQLAVRDDIEVVFVERFAARDAVAVYTQVGGRFALPPTGVGLVLLAHAPVEVQDRVLAGPLKRFTPAHRHRSPAAAAGCSPRSGAPAWRSATGRSPSTRCPSPPRSRSAAPWSPRCRSSSGAARLPPSGR